MKANTCRSYFHKTYSWYIIQSLVSEEHSIHFYKPLTWQMLLSFYCSTFKQYYFTMSVSAGLSELGWCYFRNCLNHPQPLKYKFYSKVLVILLCLKKYMWYMTSLVHLRDSCTYITHNLHKFFLSSRGMDDRFPM